MPTITRNEDTRETLSLDVNDWLESVSLKRVNPETGIERITVDGDALYALHAEIGKVLDARATRQKHLEQIAALTPEQVVQSYSGKPGCACGCKGNYSTRLNTIKLVLSRLQEFAPHARNRDLIVTSNSQGGICFGVDTETYRGTPRAYTVYVGPGWV